MSVGALTNID